MNKNFFQKPIDKLPQMWYNGRPLYVREGAEFSIIPHFQVFVKAFSKNFLKNNFPKSVDKMGGICYNR
jgi:hypothetical protein